MLLSPDGWIDRWTDKIDRGWMEGQMNRSMDGETDSWAGRSNKSEFGGKRFKEKVHFKYN